MQRAPVLPCLPGFNFDRNIGRTKFHRNQYFDKVHDGVYYLSERADTGGYSRYPSIYARGEVQELPPWIAFDGQRLTFKAFFQETLQERRLAPFQIRVVNLSFFLEDGTMKISEPAVDNSGLEQGVLVRRQRIPMPNPVRHRYYDIIDLNVGKELEIFGRVYKIVDCDKFTRRFLNRIGIPVPDPIDIPKGTLSDSRKDIFPKKPKRSIDTRGDFMKYDRQVLRFYAYWDNREAEHGTIHDLELRYYLADRTIEIKEKIPPNSGRDTGAMFLKKSRVPKFYSGLEPIGSKDPFTVLNVLGEDKIYFTVDPLNVGRPSSEYYDETELGIGARVNVYGREIVITDMDAFTKEFYRKKYGINDFQPLTRPGDTGQECRDVPKYIPPYNGFGSYEDSLGNCFTVMPKPPKADFVKFLHHDKQGFDSRVLRFRAKMLSNIPENEERQFIVRFFLMNDTISVFELTKRNSGFRRCLFQKRMPVMLPGQNIFTNKKPEYYRSKDFYVGATMNLCGFQFLLTSADVYTLRYMELHPDEFPKANAKAIMSKLRDALKPVYKEFLREYSPPETENGVPVIEYKKFREALCKYLGDKITEHEMITVARCYSSHEKQEAITREYVRRLMHTELQRFLWNDLDRLGEDLRHWDRGRTGFLPRETVYAVLRACRMPVDVELLNSMLDHLRKNDEGRIDYNDLLRFANTKIDPVPPATPINAKTALWWASERDPECGAGIDFGAFLKDLDVSPEDNSATQDS